MFLKHSSSSVTPKHRTNGSRRRCQSCTAPLLAVLIFCSSALAILASAAFLPSHHRAISLSVFKGEGGERPSIALFSSPPGGGGRAKARRTLKKRRRSKRKTDAQTNEKDDFPSDKNVEIRPLVRSTRIEAGEDYWIDEEDLKKSLERDQAIANRKAMEGEIPKEKLKTEVVAPYKQNWIGLFSVGIVTLAVIINKFPELLQTPVIPIPDL